VLAANHNRTLHQLGVLEEEFDDVLSGSVVARVEAQLFEVLVLANELRRRLLEQIQEALQVLSSQRVVDVFDDVELDAALAQNLDCAAGLASARVVKDLNSLHAKPPRSEL
jgi:hypothetical protein